MNNNIPRFCALPEPHIPKLQMPSSRWIPQAGQGFLQRWTELQAGGLAVLWMAVSRAVSLLRRKLFLQARSSLGMRMSRPGLRVLSSRQGLHPAAWAVSALLLSLHLPCLPLDCYCLPPHFHSNKSMKFAIWSLRSLMGRPSVCTVVLLLTYFCKAGIFPT